MKKLQLSPNSLNLYLECQQCFWLDKRMGIKRPSGNLYQLNVAVDALLREEFDLYRKRGQVHPLLEDNSIEAKLFSNQRLLDTWRDAKEGLVYYDKELQATLFGAPDDVLEFNGGIVAPLDYKSTGGKISKVYDQFQLQLDVYTFLLQKNGYKTNTKGYLAFYVVDKDKGFLDRLPFRKELHQVKTNPEEVYDIFKDAVMLLKKEAPKEHSEDCLFAAWFEGTKRFS